MLPRSVAVLGPAAPDVAWRRYTELAAWAQWAPTIRRVQADGDRLRTGLTGVVHGPAGLRVPFEVLEVDEPARTWHWRVRVGPLTLEMVHDVLARPAGGCVATLLVDGPAVAAAYLPAARSALSRLVALDSAAPGRADPGRPGPTRRLAG